ncbi:polyribonucleotide nucleotidyltransferase [Fredinandcohnia quinoae]|uniref:Polyribonucleotide nucleotidyltransferase n=1 Tax=Fredinandcohnia quinoae TaxID=2918902 RepID=A0AAW5E7Q0_9BACI|nr:polyribonucleotide nucleotidyltransferase [Fredinandcohnia sp. SECRCQ15]MCH1625421.1 polyribonucleotide nucleotidyltransferase [Fredinandcohnia sp. SECRCQ15]
MNISSIMSNNVLELQRTLSMNLLKSQMATQAAQAVVMLEDFNSSAKAGTSAPHPTLGKSVDISG